MSLSLPFQISNIRLFWTWVGCCWFCNWILLIMKNWICYHPIWSYFNYIKNIYKKCFTLSWKLDKLLLVVHGWNAANYSKKMHLKVKKCVASFAFSWVPVTFHKDECLYSTFTSSLSHMQCTDTRRHVLMSLSQRRKRHLWGFNKKNKRSSKLKWRKISCFHVASKGVKIWYEKWRLVQHSSSFLASINHAFCRLVIFPNGRSTHTHLVTTDAVWDRWVTIC